MLTESPIQTDISETPARLPRLARRGLLAAATAALVLTPACGESWMPGQATLENDDPVTQWRAFRDRFVTGDGRVVDDGNGGISHSEGQGYAMLFAEAFDDRATFTRVLHWTRNNLRRPDGLHAWRFRPQGRPQVEDNNNATDGDLYIAWALLRAADRWQDTSWRREGQRMAQTILQKLVVEVEGRALLLPGAHGFNHADRVVLNPSYYAFPALAALNRALPDRTWSRLIDDGQYLLRGARFGRWGLPADWVEIRRGANGAHVQPASGWPARFSYDAVRVPLHLAWAGMGTEPALRASAHFWHGPWTAGRPAWADLLTGGIAPYMAPAGVEAVAEVTLASQQHRDLARPLPGIGRGVDYYSAALSLLARLAMRENPRNLLAQIARQGGAG